MNELTEQIEKEFKEALKNARKDDVAFIRALKTAFGNTALTKKGNLKAPLSLEEMQDVIRKQIEKCNESVVQFVKGQREDLAAKERAEAAFLEKYLPAEISDGDLEGLIYLALQEYDNPTKKNMGEIISKVFSAAGGNANRKRIAAALSTKLK